MNNPYCPTCGRILAAALQNGYMPTDMVSGTVTFTYSDGRTSQQTSKIYLGSVCHGHGPIAGYGASLPVASEKTAIPQSFLDAFKDEELQP